MTKNIESRGIGYSGNNLFFFLKQSNGEYDIKVNPEYLKDYRFLKGMTQPEMEAMLKLDEVTWSRLLAQLKTLNLEDKKALLKREWSKSWLAEHDMPSAVEKRFLDVLTNSRTILLNK